MNQPIPLWLTRVVVRKYVLQREGIAFNFRETTQETFVPIVIKLKIKVGLYPTNRIPFSISKVCYYGLGFLFWNTVVKNNNNCTSSG